MSHYKLTFNVSDKRNFDWIKSGTKKFESRAGSDEYNKIHSGDIVTFDCSEESFDKIVKQRYDFANLNELLEAFTIKDIMPDNPSREEAIARWLSYPGYEKRIKENGIIVWELKNI